MQSYQIHFTSIGFVHVETFDLNLEHPSRGTNRPTTASLFHDLHAWASYYMQANKRLMCVGSRWRGGCVQLKEAGLSSWLRTVAARLQEQPASVLLRCLHFHLLNHSICYSYYSIQVWQAYKKPVTNSLFIPVYHCLIPSRHGGML